MLFQALLCIFLVPYVWVDGASPHIILIVADDLGWNDVGFHGSNQIPTPNIDALAYAGVILNNYYVQPICTPSRSALLTGYHPIHTGLQSYTIGGAQPYGLPLSVSTLPEHLASLGYVSRIVGKWHLGLYHREYTPLFRGFSSHFGYWTGRIDYYDHTSFERPNYWGLDFRRNMDADLSSIGKYATDLFTDEAVKVIEDHNTTIPLFLYLSHLAVHSANTYDPLQAPQDIIDKFSHIEDSQRRIFAAMLWKLDESVGRVIEVLERKGMLKNSIIIFTTDNGGPAAGFNQNAASNWPLRGVKASLWEGGVRGAAAIWSPLIKNPGRVSNDMMQIMDWFPTLLTASGGSPSDFPETDGLDLWSTIVSEEPSLRTNILHNIDPVVGGASIRIGDWKLLYKPSAYGEHWNKWFGPSGRNNVNDPNLSKSYEDIVSSAAGKAFSKTVPYSYERIVQIRKNAEVLCAPIPTNATQYCNEEETPCLFHIPSDPCEYYDLSDRYPLKVKALQNLLRYYEKSAVPNLNQPYDPTANPIYWNYTWTNWKDYNPPIEYPYITNYSYKRHINRIIFLLPLLVLASSML